MELKFQKSVCKYLIPQAGQLMDQELTQEIRLPDGMPDVGRVLAGWGQVILRSKEWRGDTVSVSAGLMVWVLYVPEDGSAPRTLESWIPFQVKWDIPSGSREGSIRISSTTRFVDPRTISARKIMVRAGVAAWGETMVPGEAEMGTAGELPEDVQLLRRTYPVRLPKEAGEKTFLVDEELTLPGSSPVPKQLVYYTMSPQISEKRILGNKLLFRGSGNLHMLYLSGEGQLHSWDFELPFSQFGDLNGTYSTEAQGEVAMAVTSLELEKGEEGRLRLKCGMLAQYLVDDREMLELIEDAYSTLRQVEMEQSDLELPVILERREEPVRGTQSIRHDANVIADVEFLPDIPHQRRTGDQLQLELSGMFQTLYYGEDGSLQSGQTRWEGDKTLEADPETILEPMLVLQERPKADTAGDQIGLEADMRLLQNSRAVQRIPMVMGLQLGEEKAADPARPSLILRRAGETSLWDIAKSTGSTVEAIRRANGLEMEPAAHQVLLIPVS